MLLFKAFKGFHRIKHEIKFPNQRDDIRCTGLPVYIELFPVNISIVACAQVDNPYFLLWSILLVNYVAMYAMFLAVAYDCMFSFNLIYFTMTEIASYDRNLVQVMIVT